MQQVIVPWGFSTLLPKSARKTSGTVSVEQSFDDLNSDFHGRLPAFDMFEELRFTAPEFEDGGDSVIAGKIKPISLLSLEFEINMYAVTFGGIGEFACEDIPSLLSTFLDILVRPSSKQQTSLDALRSFSGGLLGSEIDSVNLSV